MKKGGPARCTSGFEPGGWYPCHSERRRNERCEVILADERRSGKVSEIEDLHLIGAHMGIRKAFLPGLNCERAQVSIGQNAERRLSDSGHYNWSHILRVACGGKRAASLGASGSRQREIARWWLRRGQRPVGRFCNGVTLGNRVWGKFSYIPGEHEEASAEPGFGGPKEADS